MAATGGAYAAYASTASATTGISVNAAGTNASLNPATTGISIQNTGSGTAFSILPPYYALCFIMRVS